MADGARLDHLSLLERGEFILPGKPGGAVRHGPWSRTKLSRWTAAPRSAGRVAAFRQRSGQTVGLFLFQALGLAALLPGTILLNELERRHSLWICVPAALPAAVSFILLLTLEIAAVKWLLLGRVQPGNYPRHGSFALRKWFVDQLLALSLDILGPPVRHALPQPVVPAAGRAGRAAGGISTASFVSPDLLTVGEESFVADAVSLGAAHVERDTVRVDAVRIGQRSFIGNSAMLPPGTTVATIV